MYELLLAAKILIGLIAIIAMIKSLHIASYFEEKGDKYRSIKWLMITIIFQLIIVIALV